MYRLIIIFWKVKIYFIQDIKDITIIMNVSVTIPILLYYIIVVFICVILIRWSLNTRTKFIKQKNNRINESNKPQLII